MTFWAGSQSGRGAILGPAIAGRWSGSMTQGGAGQQKKGEAVHRHHSREADPKESFSVR